MNTVMKLNILIILLVPSLNNVCYSQDLIDIFNQAVEILSTPSERNVDEDDNSRSNYNNVVDDQNNVETNNGKGHITPFGTLEWDDGLYDVITKLSNHPGIKIVELVGRATTYYVEQGIATAEEEATSATLNVTQVPGREYIADYLSKGYTSKITNTNPNSDDLALGGSGVIGRKINQYIGPDKQPARYAGGPNYNGDADISWEAAPVVVAAGPINIANVLYIIKAEFNIQPGLSLYKQENILYSTQYDLNWPLIMTRVVLETNPDVSEQQSRQVLAALESKFSSFARDPKRDFDWETFSGRTSVNVSDNFGSRFSARIPQYLSGRENWNINLEYSSNGLAQKLYDMYKEHEANLRVDAVKGSGIIDSSSDL